MNKSCHTALKYVQKYFTGTKWFVEGDIKGCFDNVDHHVLTAILRKRIVDEHFIGLLWKFLKAGYMEELELSQSLLRHSPRLCASALSRKYIYERTGDYSAQNPKFKCGNRRKINPH